MIAGGTGITPMLQLLKQIEKEHQNINESNKNNKNNKSIKNNQRSVPPKVSLIFGNISKEDILLEFDLQTMKKQNNEINVYFTLDKVINLYHIFYFFV